MNRLLSRAAMLAALPFALASTLPIDASAAQPRVKHAAARVAASTAAVPSFAAHLFATGSQSLFNPDAIAVTQHFVFVAWQNASDHTSAPSTIVRYDRAGHVTGSVNLNGRCDGMKYDAATHMLWALVNNDGQNGSPPRQPGLYVINPRTLAATSYAFPAKAAHGGGYDDLAFINGRAFASASSATLTSANTNPGPAIVELRLQGTNVSVTPLVYGNATGYDVASGHSATLNITDPDSLTVTPGGTLVLTSQGDQQVIVVHDPLLRTRYLVRYPVGTQLDDIAYTLGTSGVLWVADTTKNSVYAIAASFPSGTIFVEAPLGGPVANFIGTIGQGGVLTPLLTQRDGISNPTSLVFTIPGQEDPD